ncbi:MAG: ribose-phosphate diphosphokinase [Thermoplasmatales archaeon]|nr:MAG: ribose-phosphate diphosphokinase [Thermoplasmatales archaeon]
MFVIGGNASKSVAEDLSKKLKTPLATMISKRFPDDECYIRLGTDVSGEDVIIVQTTYPNTNIVELLLIQDAVVEAGAENTTVIIPYFGYSRQDKKFEAGEPISARAIAEHISLHADCIITVDPHKGHLLDFFMVPAYSCSAVAEIAQYLKKQDIDFVLAPDKGAIKRAQQASDIIGCKYDYMEKTRIDGTTVKLQPKNLDAENKKVAIIDDIISTGGTMAQSINELKRQGAKKVSVACTHGLFVGEAKEKLLSAGCDEIISTDTIENEFSKVRAAPCIAEILLKKLH